MKVSFNWLQEYIQEPLPSLDEVVSALTMHSFEIEGVLKTGDDSILDVKILPNRSHDCLSHYGIASEIASVMGLTRKSIGEKIDIPALPRFTVEIKEKDLCTRMFAILIADVHVGDSPQWLKDRLQSMGQRSINTVVDITNYSMYALGQPMHAFDRDTISGDAIYVRKAKNGEKIKLLNDKEYELNSDMIVIADKEKALDVAGIMGGTYTATYTSTKNILLVVDNFDPVSIRKTSKKLGVRTDASVRFENGISSSLVDRSLSTTLELLLELTGGTLVGGGDVYPKPEKVVEIQTSSKNISSILGVEISSEKIIELLGRQHIHAEEKNETIIVSVPSERLDIRLEEDLAEEVGRMYGYENIAPQELSMLDRYEVNTMQYIQQKIRLALSRIGFSEIYTYGFVSKGEIELENPLAQDKKFLRSSLLPAMSASLEHNVKFVDLLGIPDVFLYEIGTVFRESGEFLHLALGVKLTKGKKSDMADECIARAIHSVEDELGVSVGDVSIVGGVAEINIERIVKDVKIPKEYPDNFWSIGSGENSSVSYTPISPYPFAVRDVAVFVPSTVSAEAVEGIVRTHFTPIVVRFSLFDTFTKNMPDGVSKTSYAFRLVFQSGEKTLTDDDINAVMNPVYESLKSQEGFEIR